MIFMSKYSHFGVILTILEHKKLVFKGFRGLKARFWGPPMYFYPFGHFLAQKTYLAIINWFRTRRTSKHISKSGQTLKYHPKMAIFRPFWAFFENLICAILAQCERGGP